MNAFREDVMLNYQDQKYLEMFWQEFLSVWIAAQIRVLRESRGWTQQVLAEKAKMKQPRISALEDADYSSWTVATLKRLARAFGVTLSVEFRSYGRLLRDFDRYKREGLEEPPLSEDRAFDDAVSEYHRTSPTHRSEAPTILVGPGAQKAKIQDRPLVELAAYRARIQNQPFPASRLLVANHG